MSTAPTIALVGPNWREALRAMDIAAGDGRAAIRVAAFEDAPAPDYLAFFTDAPVDFRTDIPVSRRIIVISEPGGIMRYHPAFLAQFGIAISPFPLPGYRGRLIIGQPGIPWFYGCRFRHDGPPVWRFPAAELLARPRPAKEDIISVVLSKKTMTALHVQRLRCVEALEKAFPRHIRVFGSGFSPVDDKADVIDPARFHLALENTRHPHYWTEKIADSYLGWAMPLYDGAPDIGTYFPEASLARLDVTQPQAAIRLVGGMLEQGEAAVDVAALAGARERLILEYSLPAILRRAVAGLPREAAPGASIDTLRANRQFSLKNRLRALIGGWKKR